MEETAPANDSPVETPPEDQPNLKLNPPGAFMAFLGVAGLGYVAMLVFVFAFGLYGETLTSGIDLACAEAAFQSGKQFEAEGNYDTAIQRYRQALQGRFSDKNREYQCARSIGEVLGRLGRYEEAVDAYKTLSPDAFTLPGHWTGYVTALFRGEDYEEAARLGKEWLDKARAANDLKQLLWANSILGQVCEKLNRLDEALNYYRAVTVLDPESDAAILAARVLKQQGKPDEAIRQLDAYLAAAKTGQLREDAQKLRAELTTPPAAQ